LWTCLGVCNRSSGVGFLRRGEKSIVKLYVGNLPFSMKDDELRGLFEPHGDVASANVITDRETGRSRGFGFVELLDDTAAKNAIEAMQDVTADGRPLVVNEARPKNRSGGRRSGGGGGETSNW
jgi:cold-inducible RNA-binding protein